MVIVYSQIEGYRMHFIIPVRSRRSRDPQSDLQPQDWPEGGEQLHRVGRGCGGVWAGRARPVGVLHLQQAIQRVGRPKTRDQGNDSSGGSRVSQMGASTLGSTPTYYLDKFLSKSEGSGGGVRVLSAHLDLPLDSDSIVIAQWRIQDFRDGGCQD